MLSKLFQRWRARRCDRLPMPPRRLTESGAPRRIGVELEFSGLGIETIARHLHEAVGGSIDPLSPYEYDVTDTEFGTFHIELDSDYIKRLGRRDDDKPDDESFFSFDKLSDDLIGAVAKQVVPFEIVTPPMPMTALHRLNPLIEKLRTSGARGTHHSPIYAFGLHMNPELPDVSASTITAYLQAFVCLFPWLAKQSRVDWSRRITPYIDRFGADYNRLITEPDYAPDMDRLIDDYLRYNATRNRALDMLPVFAHVDEPRVAESVSMRLVKARPALHYRLPNCLIDEPGWTLAEPWRHWLQVEHLAADDARRAEVMAGFREHLDDPLSRLFDVWARTCERWLVDLDD